MSSPISHGSVSLGRLLFQGVTVLPCLTQADKGPKTHVLKPTLVLINKLGVHQFALGLVAGKEYSLVLKHSLRGTDSVGLICVDHLLQIGVGLLGHTNNILLMLGRAAVGAILS